MFVFFNDTATTEIYTLSLHDALPILSLGLSISGLNLWQPDSALALDGVGVLKVSYEDAQALTREQDRKSTRLNSSHANISYAVFCLKKKTNLHPRPPYHSYSTSLFTT